MGNQSSLTRCRLNLNFVGLGGGLRDDRPRRGWGLERGLRGLGKWLRGLRGGLRIEAVTHISSFRRLWKGV